MNTKSAIKTMQDDGDVHGLLDCAVAASGRAQADIAIDAIKAIGPSAVPQLIAALAAPAKRSQAIRTLRFFKTAGFQGAAAVLLDPAAAPDTVEAALELVDPLWLQFADGRAWLELQRIAAESPHEHAKARAAQVIAVMGHQYPQREPEDVTLPQNRRTGGTSVAAARAQSAQEKRTAARLTRLAHSCALDDAEATSGLGQPVRGEAGGSSNVIPLNDSEFALIDASDWSLVSRFEWTTWQLSPNGTLYAATRSTTGGDDIRLCVVCGSVIKKNAQTGRWSKYCDDCKRRPSSVRRAASNRYYGNREWRNELMKYDELLMHRLIVGAQPGWVVHHYNGDGLDNRRCNLLLLGSDEHQRLHEAEWRGEERSPCGHLTPIGIERYGYPVVVKRYAGEKHEDGTWGCLVTATLLGVLIILAALATSH